MSEVTVAEERPDQAEAAELMRQSDAFSAALYPPGTRVLTDAASLSAGNVRFFVARRDGKALGCMALARTGPDKGELQRCFVTEEARGQGVGFALLQATPTGYIASVYNINANKAGRCTITLSTPGPRGIVCWD